MQKGEAIQQAYAQIRISGLTVDPVPEDNQIALLELDQLMYEWAGRGRVVGYNFPPPTTGDELVVSTPSDLFGVAPWAISGAIASLACRVTEYFGKAIPDTLARKRRVGVNTIKQNTVSNPTIPYPNRMPRGGGNIYRTNNYQRYYHPTYTDPNARPIVDEQIKDYTRDYTNLLAPGDSIASYVIEADPNGGVVLISDSRDGNVITYRVQADETRPGEISINVTTTNGLTLPTTVCFDVLRAAPCQN